MHVVEKRFALLLAYGTPLVGTAAVDGAFDLEQRIQTPDRLQRNRGDWFAFLSVPGSLLDVGQFEEAPPRMGEAECRVIGSIFLCGSNRGSKPL